MNELRSPEQIEREITEIRAQIDHTLDAVQEKLSPGELLDQALTYVKDETGVFAGNFGRAVQSNPIPATLLGISLAWLAFAARSEPRSQGAYRPEGSRYRGDGYGGRSWSDTTAERWHDTTDRVSTATSDVSESVRSTLDAASAKASEMAEQGRDLGHRLGDRAAEMKDSAATRASRLADEAAYRWHGAGERVREVGARVYDRWDTTRREVIHGSTSTVDFLKHNPLALVAVGVAAGAVVAAMLPRTQREDELLGETRDELVGTVKDTVASAAAPVLAQAEQAVAETVETAKDAAQRFEDDASADSGSRDAQDDFAHGPDDPLQASHPPGPRPVTS
jgi:hypothetical protein